MPKITRPDTNVEGFSSDIDTGGRLVFGGSDQTNDLTANLTPEFLKGWNQEGAKPNRQWFNGAMFTTSQLVSYLFQMGIAEWNENQEYYTNSKCTSPINGFTYVSKTGTAPSTPNPGTTDPSLDTTNWRIESMQTIGDQTIAGNKNFTGTTELDRAIISYNDADRVFTIGTSTLDSVYEFVSPDGTIVGENSNGSYWKYVDGKLVCTSYVFPLNATASTLSSTSVVYPIAFMEATLPSPNILNNNITPNATISFLGTVSNNYSTTGADISINGSITGVWFLKYTAIGRWK